MRVVFDTVALVRGLINPFSRAGKLLFDLADAYELIVSPSIIAEYLDVLRRPEVTRKYRHVATRDAHAILELLAQAIVVEPIELPSISRDPNDDIFFAPAKVGGAAYIISEDRDQLDIETYAGIKVLTTEAFLAILTRGDSEDAAAT